MDCNFVGLPFAVPEWRSQGWFPAFFLFHDEGTTSMFLPLHGWLYLVPLLRKGGTSTTTSQMQSTRTIQPDTRYNLTSSRPFYPSMSSMGSCTVLKSRKGLPGAGYCQSNQSPGLIGAVLAKAHVVTQAAGINRSTTRWTDDWGPSAARVWMVHSTGKGTWQRVLQ